MKKILAGVLASASLLTMTVSASAASTDKNVKAAGEVEYDVSVTAPKITLDLVLPAKLEAALNPYGAEIELVKGDALTNGIVSVAYTINNKSTGYGVWVDATAVTTVTTTDKDKWTVKAVEADKKGAALALVGGNEVADIVAAAADVSAIVTAKAADDGTGKPVQGALVMDSTVAADKTTGKAAGQTSQKKFMFVGAESEAVMAFVGELGTGDDIEWTEDDAINVALVLKISAGSKTIDGSGTTTPGGFTADVAAGDITWTGTAATLGNLTANNTYAVAYDGSVGGNCTPAFAGYTINNVTGATTGITVNGSGRFSCSTDGTYTLQYELEKTSDSSTTTITLVITATGC